MPLQTKATSYRMLGKTFRGLGSYRYGFNGMEKDDEIKGEGNSYTTLFRQYDSRLGRWLSRDPLATEYPWQSPYISMDGNPISLNDPFGNSTHTDENGNVVAVYDDDNLGVFSHTGLDSEMDYQSDENKLGSEGEGVTKMGETHTPFGFADFNHYEKTGELKPGANAWIDFESTWAGDKVDAITDENPTLLDYAKKAGTNGVWDLKSVSKKDEYSNSYYYGSLLEGKYVSARDAGNIAAGKVAQKSNYPTQFVKYGYGLYNQSGNNKPLAAVMMAMDVINGIRNPIYGVGIFIYRSEYGEDKLSQAGIEKGIELQKQKE